ncbi:uncharacterized protein C5L36_0A08800 [Pichia kudriavzevii]|uniref:Uncharacterized protein n=2 Tax=Pichia kudriavzevii TaxID=4909 RepID=A0A2U9QZ56_PICKU|nr:uncharacterized protein C5L36_0A08800 [Pichia kudriavzevii]AWU74286.1 hypothetical protein C5L36_0A08800 [Pichia kudriavzevii]
MVMVQILDSETREELFVSLISNLFELSSNGTPQLNHSVVVQLLSWFNDNSINTYSFGQFPEYYRIDQSKRLWYLVDHIQRQTMRKYVYYNNKVAIYAVVDDNVNGNHIIVDNNRKLCSKCGHFKTFSCACSHLLLSLFYSVSPLANSPNLALRSSIIPDEDTYLSIIQNHSTL